VSEPALTAVVIEDDKPIRRFLRTALESEGLQVFEAETGKQGLIEAGTRKPDLVILDLGLPDMNGVEVIRDLRSWTDLPVIVLSARTHETDKVDALDAGADDYLTKPFGVGELLARIRVALRRRARANLQAAAEIQLGGVRVDLANRRVFRGDEPIHLTPIEFRLLAVLVRNAGRVLTHRQLLKEVWGPSRADSTHYLRIYTAHLRQKLEDDPARPRHILTETGVGYRLVS
jgi:two-component system KDP operon response regulator KdpE